MLKSSNSWLWQAASGNSTCPGAAALISEEDDDEWCCVCCGCWSASAAVDAQADGTLENGNSGELRECRKIPGGLATRNEVARPSALPAKEDRRFDGVEFGVCAGAGSLVLARCDSEGLRDNDEVREWLGEACRWAAPSLVEPAEPLLAGAEGAELLGTRDGVPRPRGTGVETLSVGRRGPPGEEAVLSRRRDDEMPPGTLPELLTGLATSIAHPEWKLRGMPV